MLAKVPDRFAEGDGGVPREADCLRGGEPTGAAEELAAGKDGLKDAHMQKHSLGKRVQGLPRSKPLTRKLRILHFCASMWKLLAMAMVHKRAKA